MELSEKELKSYKEYLQTNENSIFFTFPFFKRLIENKVDLNEFTKVCHTYFYNHYFLEWYLAGDLSEKKKEILYDEFSANTHIELYRNYFCSVAEEISESKGVKTIELTAYGISKSQNRSVIAFRGIFKNDLLVSYESKIQNCEPYSYHRNDELNLTYTLTDQKFLEEIIKYDYSEILDEKRLNDIYSIWFNSIKLRFDSEKKFLSQNMDRFWIGEEISSGLLIDERTLTYHVIDYIDKLFDTDDLTLVKVNQQSYPYSKEGYYMNDYLDLFEKHVAESDFYSEKIKKSSPTIYFKINFELEKSIFSEIQRLKTESIENAKEMAKEREAENERLLKEQKKAKIGLFIRIAIVIIAFLLLLNYMM